MATPAVWEVVYRYRKFDDITAWRCLNVIHYTGSYAVGKSWLTSGQVVVDRLSTLWAARARQCMADDWTYQGCVGYEVTGDARTMPCESTAGQITGELAAPGLPSQNAVVIKKRTNNAGRAYRGRLYLPGAPVAEFVGGRWSDAYMAILAAAGWPAVLTEQINAPAVDPDVTLRGCLAKKPFTTGAAAEKLLVTVAFDQVIRAQRRRQPGRGY